MKRIRLVADATLPTHYLWCVEQWQEGNSMFDGYWWEVGIFRDKRQAAKAFLALK